MLLVAIVLLAGCTSSGESEDQNKSPMKIVETKNDGVVVDVAADGKVNDSGVEYVLLIDEEGNTVDASLVTESEEYNLERDGSEVAVAAKNKHGDQKTIDID